VLQVTSRRKGNWILPKGQVKSGKTATVSVVEEMYEEAGARGTIGQGAGSPVRLPFDRSGEGAANEQMPIFSLEVDTTLPIWPEMFQRQRRWLNLQDVELVKGAHFRATLKRFATIMAPIT
jgi:8-oxo-dGTP pyrophosphatase MutT (NUDIX family)